MSMYITDTYILRCLTHLHAGKGEANMGVIDKQVQRDPITAYPVVHSSGLKGALREHFRFIASETNSKELTDQIQVLFGSDQKDDEQGKRKAKTGELFFGQAYLLSLPVRSNVKPYLHATTLEILSGLLDKMDLYDAAQKGEFQSLLEKLQKLNLAKPTVFHSYLEGSILEEENYEVEVQALDKEVLTKLEAVIGGPFATVDSKTFKDFTDSLPIIARNHLDNGISQNLWYEEIVPRETRFFMGVKGKETHTINFSQYVANKVIQVGGNATVGMGQILYKKLSI